MKRREGCEKERKNLRGNIFSASFGCSVVNDGKKKKKKKKKGKERKGKERKEKEKEKEKTFWVRLPRARAGSEESKLVRDKK